MKTVANTSNEAILAEIIPAVRAGSGSVYMVIDDFNTGPQTEIRLQSGKVQPGFRNGTMLGGSRHIVYRVDEIPSGVSLGREGVYTIKKGHLIVEDGVHMASRLEISYGIAENNDVASVKSRFKYSPNEWAVHAALPFTRHAKSGRRNYSASHAVQGDFSD